MPNVKITLNDGTTKTVRFEDGFTEADIEEVASQLNANIKPTVEEKKGVDLSPKAIGERIGNALAAPIVAAREDLSLGEAYNKNVKKSEESANKPINKFGNAVADFALYSSLPILKSAQGAGALAKGGAFLGNAGIQGGIPGLIEGAEQGDALGGAGTGAGVALGVQTALSGLPIVGRGISKAINNPKFQQGVANTLEAFTSVPSDYSKTALQNELAGNSIFKGGFDADTAYIPIERKLRQAKEILPTKENFAQEYNRLGKRALEGMDAIKEQAGAKINEVLQGLDVAPTDISGLRNSVSSVLKGFSRGGDINPANIRANKEIELINNMLGIKNQQQIGAELADYAQKNSINALANSPEYNKEAAEVAFNVLSQATKRDKNWLKSQLNAQLPGMSTQKRQEFIERLLEQTDDKIDNIDPNWSNYFPELQSLRNDSTNGVDIARKMFDRILNKDFRNIDLIFEIVFFFHKTT